jgi:hypothetical protein
MLKPPRMVVRSRVRRAAGIPIMIALLSHFFNGWSPLSRCGNAAFLRKFTIEAASLDAAWGHPIDNPSFCGFFVIIWLSFAYFRSQSEDDNESTHDHESSFLVSTFCDQ